MALQVRLFQLAVSILGPSIVPALRKAVEDPRTRSQVTAILGQIRRGVGGAAPSAQRASRLRRDLDVMVTLTQARLDGARDDHERELALGWVREAQDVRHAADIAGALRRGGERELVEQLRQRREALLLGMLDATLHTPAAAVTRLPPLGLTQLPNSPEAPAS